MSNNTTQVTFEHLEHGVTIARVSAPDQNLNRANTYDPLITSFYDPLKAFVEQRSDSPRTLVIDMGDILDTGPAVLGKLISLKVVCDRQTREENPVSFEVAGIKPEFRQAFRISSLDTVFKCHTESADDVARRLGGNPGKGGTPEGSVSNPDVTKKALELDGPSQ